MKTDVLIYGGRNGRMNTEVVATSNNKIFATAIYEIVQGHNSGENYSHLDQFK